MTLVLGQTVREELLRLVKARLQIRPIDRYENQLTARLSDAQKALEFDILNTITPEIVQDLVDIAESAIKVAEGDRKVVKDHTKRLKRVLGVVQEWRDELGPPVVVERKPSSQRRPPGPKRRYTGP